MKVEKYENEIVMRVSKDDKLYGLLETRKDVGDYIEKLVVLSVLLAGTGDSDIYNCYENNEEIKEKYKTKTWEELMTEREMMIQEIIKIPEIMSQFIPTDAYMTDDGLINVGENDAVYLAKIYKDRIDIINDIINERSDLDE